jgi:PBP1b-binding outer membrane lipoprotein LpoB
LAVLFFAALLLSGCMHALSPAQKMQDAANDLTTATRFGRMDAALERVSNEGRDDFLRKHAAWGSAIRVADCELSGLRMTDQESATVTLTVSWQRIDESDLRGTQITQHWKSHQGKWLLESEERSAGDVGLLGESTTVVRAAPTRTQFESITIR